MTSELLKNYDASEETIRKLYDSRLRLAILDALKDKPMRLADLRRAVGANAPNTSTKAKDLEKMGIVERVEGDFQLTPWGQAIRRQTKKCFDFHAAHETFKDFWDMHRTEGIPDELWDDIGMLRNSTLLKMIKGDQSYANDMCAKMLSSIGKEFYSIFPFYLKVYPTSVESLVKRGAGSRCILSEDIVKIMTSRTHKSTLTVLFSSPNSRFFVYRGDLGVNLVLSENFMCLALPSKANPEIFLDTILHSEDPSALVWGKHLFDHYIQKSAPIEPSDYDL